jgi:nitrogenase-stabilizing/protective protein
MLLDTLAGLSTAEQFFDTLNLPYDSKVLDVSRLHILKRFHDRLDMPSVRNMGEAEAKAACRVALEQAYQDFTQGAGPKTFKVFRQDGAPGFVPLSALLGR